MEIVKVKMPIDLFKSLTTEQRKGMDVDQIEPDDFDYSFDETWQALKKESSKAYTKLKEREYKLRNNLI